MSWGAPGRPQAGLSLVEVMVALAIGLVVVLGVTTLFSDSRQTARVQEGLARVQDNARIALHFLQQDIRMAGYVGCASKQALTYDYVGVTAGDWSVDMTQPLRGHEGVGALPVPALGWTAPTTATRVAGTDLVNVRRMADAMGRTNAVSVAATAADQAILVANPTTLFGERPGNVAVISDCAQASVFEVKSFTGAPAGIINDLGLSRTYPINSAVARLSNQLYFVATRPGRRPSLWRQRLVGGVMTSEELVEDIEDMQILYGEDRDGNGTADRYVRADEVGLDFNRVMSVRVGLLLASPEPVGAAADSQPTRLLTGVIAPPNDGRLRRVYATTIQLRNRS